MNLGILEGSVLEATQDYSLLIFEWTSSYLFGELVCVTAVRTHVTNRLWCAAVAEQNQKLMNALGVSNVITVFGKKPVQ